MNECVRCSLLVLSVDVGNIAGVDALVKAECWRKSIAVIRNMVSVRFVVFFLKIH